MGAGEPDIMTWFPRREDYEDAPVAVMPDETIDEKIDRQVLGRVAPWRRGLVNTFLRVPFACLGSRTAAVQLWNSQIIQFTKPPL